MKTEIKTADIKEGAQFKAENGIVWIIDSVEGNRVRTSMSHGAKGNYCDDIQEVVSFLNEEGAKDMNILNQESCLLVCLGGKQFFPADTFETCSKAIKMYVSQNNLGATEFYKKKNAGAILHPTKGEIAHVSYNGRVWRSEGKQIEITDLSKNDLII